ncbi:MAG: metal ABC transporter permease [Candidatus Nitrosoglobus sp.]|jgi:zinc transport system permease protein
MAFWETLVTATFLQNALIAGILASLGCGVMGSFVVVKRIGFLAGGIAHTVLGGMGVSYYLGKNPLMGALIAALLSALLIGWVSLRWREREDTLISALWSVGMAVGVIFISRTPGYSVDLMSYLFGNILMVSQEQLYLMAAVDIAIIFIMLLFYKQFLAISFDEEFARLRGVPVTFFYLLLLCMVALTVVLLIQVVGLILVIALLVLPAAIAGQYMGSLVGMMLLAVFLGTLFTSTGLIISYEPDLPAGSTIVLVAGGAYLLSTLGTGLRQHWRIRRQIH